MSRLYPKIVAVALMFVGMATPAAYADVAELEARIAALEAEAASKAEAEIKKKPKVSLNISGWVSSQLYAWDDGSEKDVYVVDNSADLGTRLNLNGDATITPSWSAGYAIALSFDTANSLATNQRTDDAEGKVVIEHSNIFIKHNRYGQLTLGQQSQPSDNASFIQSDLSGTVFPANHTLFDAALQFLRPKGGAEGLDGLSGTFWGSFGFCVGTGGFFGGECSGDRTNAFRYDTPAIGGLVLSMSAGEDNFWDLAFQWKGEAGPLSLALGGSYSDTDDTARFDGALTAQEAQYFHVGGTILHNPTGLFIFGSYGTESTDVEGASAGDHAYLKPGIKTKLNSVGTTTFYAELGRYTDAYGGFVNGSGALCGAFDGVAGTALDNACASATDTTVNVTSSEFTRTGFGVLQTIDAANMQLWAKYRHHELDIDFSASGIPGNQDFEDLDIFLVGGVIFF